MKKGFLAESGVVGNIGLKQLREQREVTTQKWETLGLLEGLDGVVKENCALLFENQLSNMINESTDASSAGQFETVAFPVIRRVFSKLLANDIVSVQALSLPIGKLYYFNPKISQRVDTTGHTSPDGAYSNAATSQNPTQFEEKSLYDSYYATSYSDEGNSLFDRNKGAFTVETGEVVITAGTVGTSQKLEGVISGFSTTNQGELVGPAGIPMDSESFLASLTISASEALSASTSFPEESIASGTPLQFHVKVQKYGNQIVNSNGELEVVIDVSYPGEDSTSNYQPLTGETTGITFNYEYRTYRDLEEDSEMAEVTFTLDEVTVTVETRKMRAQWTPELAQDVSAFHNIDAEAELTALLSEQMAAEIDREILRDLRRGAAWSRRWDYNGLRKQSNVYYGTQKDYNQTLITEVNRISAQIHKSTLRGGATWIVISPEISAVFDDLEYFHASNAAPEQDQYNMGIERVGTLQSRYQVYRDPYAPANTCLVGHRGSSILESGYIYAPYIPMQLTPILYNPFDFKPIRGIMTRYAKKLVLNRYFGKVLVDGLVSFGIGDLR
ncbi:MAG: hypothetical protein ACOC33_02235 [bacterium]